MIISKRGSTHFLNTAQWNFMRCSHKFQVQIISLRWRHNGRDGVSNPQLVCTTVYSGGDQRNHQSSASLAFVRPVNSPRKRPVARKMSPFDDVIMWLKFCIVLQGAGCGGPRTSDQPRWFRSHPQTRVPERPQPDGLLHGWLGVRKIMGKVSDPSACVVIKKRNKTYYIGTLK